MSQEFQEHWLSAYLDNELSAEERALVEQRLAEDPTTRNLLEDLQRVRGLVATLPGWPGNEFRFDASRLGGDNQFSDGTQSDMHSEIDEEEFVEEFHDRDDELAEGDEHSHLESPDIQWPGSKNPPLRVSDGASVIPWRGLLAMAAGVLILLLGAPYLWEKYGSPQLALDRPGSTEGAPGDSVPMAPVGANGMNLSAQRFDTGVPEPAKPNTAPRDSARHEDAQVDSAQPQPLSRSAESQRSRGMSVESDASADSSENMLLSGGGSGSGGFGAGSVGASSVGGGSGAGGMGGLGSATGQLPIENFAINQPVDPRPALADQISRSELPSDNLNASAARLDEEAVPPALEATAELGSSVAKSMPAEPVAPAPTPNELSADIADAPMPASPAPAITAPGAPSVPSAAVPASPSLASPSLASPSLASPAVAGPAMPSLAAPAPAPKTESFEGPPAFDRKMAPPAVAGEPLPPPSGKSMPPSTFAPEQGLTEPSTTKSKPFESRDLHKESTPRESSNESLSNPSPNKELKQPSRAEAASGHEYLFRCARSNAWSETEVQDAIREVFVYANPEAQRQLQHVASNDLADVQLKNSDTAQSKDDIATTSNASRTLNLQSGYMADKNAKDHSVPVPILSVLHEPKTLDTWYSQIQAAQPLNDFAGVPNEPAVGQVNADDHTNTKADSESKASGKSSANKKNNVARSVSHPGTILLFVTKAEALKILRAVQKNPNAEGVKPRFWSVEPSGKQSDSGPDDKAILILNQPQ